MLINGLLQTIIPVKVLLEMYPREQTYREESFTIAKAIEKEQIPTLFEIYQKTKHASLKTVIDKGAEKIVLNWIKRNDLRPPSKGPYGIQVLHSLYQSKEMERAVHEGDFVAIKNLLKNDQNLNLTLEVCFRKRYNQEGKQLSLLQFVDFLYLFLWASVRIMGRITLHANPLARISMRMSRCYQAKMMLKEISSLVQTSGLENKEAALVLLASKINQEKDLESARCFLFAFYAEEAKIFFDQLEPWLQQASQAYMGDL